jgi:hypothetical protein
LAEAVLVTESPLILTAEAEAEALVNALMILTIFRPL